LVLKPPNLPKTAENLTLHIVTEFQKQENISDDTAQFQYRSIPSGEQDQVYSWFSEEGSEKKKEKPLSREVSKYCLIDQVTMLGINEEPSDIP
jgi:hypothetical protein